MNLACWLGLLQKIFTSSSILVLGPCTFITIFIAYFSVISLRQSLVSRIDEYRQNYTEASYPVIVSSF
jgi:hypothetical protein